MAVVPTVIIVRLLLEDEGKILFLSQTQKNGGRFSLPGGKVDMGEDPKNALVREIKEETGAKISIHNLELKHIVFNHKTTKREITFYYQCNIWTGKLLVMEPNKFRTLKWFEKENPTNISKSLNESIQNIKRGVMYSNITNKRLREINHEAFFIIIYKIIAFPFEELVEQLLLLTHQHKILLIC